MMFRFFEIEEVLFEDQSEPFPYSFRLLAIGKMLSLLKDQETPIMGVVPHGLPSSN